jgi:tRNA-intron endonuclease
MEKIKAYLLKETVSSNDSLAFSIQDKNLFGERSNDKIIYSLPEALFLLEKNKIEIFSKNKKLTKQELIDKFSKIDKRFQIRYSVFKDLREKGYIVKTKIRSRLQNL